MKIVATSRATTEQLKEFQSHIDEFNEVIKRQEAERAAKSEEHPTSQPSPSPAVVESSRSSAVAESKPATPSQVNPAPPPNPPPSTPPAQAAVYNAAPNRPHQQQPPAALSSTGPGALPGLMHPIPQPTPAAGRGGPIGGYVGYPPPPPARPEPLIKHVVMEITSVPSGGHSACPDRWLFPEYAVLEMRPGGLEMICSFLVERKGSQIVSSASTEAAGADDGAEGKWKAGEEYYQPVSLTIKALNHKTIETIAKAAKTLPAVQQYMKEAMMKKKRAPVDYLVHQLPRERGHVSGDSMESGFVDSGVELASGSESEDDELKDFYGIYNNGGSSLVISGMIPLAYSIGQYLMPADTVCTAIRPEYNYRLVPSGKSYHAGRFVDYALGLYQCKKME